MIFFVIRVNLIRMQNSEENYLATKKRKTKNNFFYRRGQLQLSNVIGVVLGVSLVLALGAQYLSSKQISTPNTEQIDPTIQQHKKFIKTIAPYAEQMQRQYNVLASISIAQAILESNWGQSGLSKNYNNYYGIKGNTSQPSKYMKTQEFVNGKWITITDSFRVYRSWQESMRDHSLLLVNGTNWNPNQYQKVLQSSNYKQAAVALYNAGYATDPGYPQKLTRLIEQYQLNQYDK